MRVIAGTAGGIPLRVPGRDVRPTMDKVRAAIFSSLGDAVPGARVVDLFAGSGSLGIEALSRGAVSAVFVESDRTAADFVRRNLARTRLEGSVQTMDALRFLETYAHPEAYDLIFADPPYARTANDTDFAALLLQHVRLPGALAAGGTLVIESIGGRELPVADDGPWRLIRQREYGESSVSFFSPA